MTDTNKSLKQIRYPSSLHTCALVSRLPSKKTLRRENASLKHPFLGNFLLILEWMVPLIMVNYGPSIHRLKENHRSFRERDRETEIEKKGDREKVRQR